MNIKKRFSVAMLSCLSLILLAQNKDKADFIEQQPGFFQTVIMKDAHTVSDSLNIQPVHKKFIMVQDTSLIPGKLGNYQSYWRNPPVSQGNTGTCWCFSTTSFIESEIYRSSHKALRISEMYTVYCEYIEKARKFVEKHGESAFSDGSESNAVTRIIRKYGAMPWSAYTGLIEGRKFNNHEAMLNEMDSYLKAVKANHSWNEEWVLGTIKHILNQYMGEPPTHFIVDGKEYSPLTYVKDYLKFNPDDYVDILSYEQQPFWKRVEYEVPDNWWHNSDYYNVPLDVFMEILKKSIRNGFTIAIGGDVSEPGFSGITQAAMIPDWDIPSLYINDDARQFRFTNESTTDDHGMHLVGYCQRNGKDWYLIKDSSAGSRNNNPNAPEFGYYFFQEDYVKLKMMTLMVHKDAVKDLLARFIQ